MIIQARFKMNLSVHLPDLFILLFFFVRLDLDQNALFLVQFAENKTSDNTAPITLILMKTV